VDPDREKPSLFRGKLRFWGTMVPLVALDLWSKAAVFAFLGATAPNVGAGRTYTVWGGPVHFSLVTYWNTGTIWGLFPDWNFPLTVLRCLALIVLAYFAARTARKDRLQLHILGLISAGAMGNLYDNLTQPKGGVRDFLLFFIVRDGGESSFPAFNVADSCITVGAFAMIIWLWRADSAQAKKGKADKRARHAR
jgi:signal peptidase II